MVGWWGLARGRGVPQLRHDACKLDTILDNAGGMEPQKSIAGKAAAGAAAGSDGIGSGEEGLAAATAPALAAAPGGVSLGRAKWNRLTKNVDLAKE